jgi:hypothetical protein
MRFAHTGTHSAHKKSCALHSRLGKQQDISNEFCSSFSHLPPQKKTLLLYNGTCENNQTTHTHTFRKMNCISESFEQ